MKAEIKFKGEKIDVVDIIEGEATPFGGSSQVICPKKYRYHRVKILVLKEKMKP